MGVREDCRHYLHRSTPAGEALQRCRLSVNEENPFACPDGCVFFEDRVVPSAGWTVAPPATPMSNTADALNSLPPPSKRRLRRKRR